MMNKPNGKRRRAESQMFIMSNKGILVEGENLPSIKASAVNSPIRN